DGGAHLGAGVVGVGDAYDGAGDAGEHAFDADALAAGVLEHAVAVARPGDVADDDEHGDAFEVGAGDAGDGVGGAWAGGDDDDGDPARGAVEAGGLEGGVGLVAGLDEGGL